MAAVVDYVADIEYSVSDSGTEVVRERGISADSFADIVNGKLLPAYGTRHPDFPALRLVSANISQSGNDGGKWQGWWRGTYSSKSEVTAVDKDPWELDAQEYSKDPFQIEVPMIGGYDKKGKYHRLLNSAGCILQRQKTIYGHSHKFIYCVRGNKKAPDFGNNAVINATSCKVAGETFDAFTAMLLPPSVSFRVEYDDDGTVKRSYWEVSVEIRVHPETWETETLNVGTMARFKNEKGEIIKTPEQIYKYTPWNSKNAAENYAVKPKFGSIRDVAKAKHDYAILVSGGAKNDDYYKAYNELPWEEVTEPLPLRQDGTVYTEAMADPDNNEYYVLPLFDTVIGSFSQFGFPQKRER